MNRICGRSRGNGRREAKGVGLELKDGKRNRDKEDEKIYSDEREEVLVSFRKGCRAKKYLKPDSDSVSDQDGTETSKKEDKLDVEIEHDVEEQHKRHEDTNGDDAEGESHTQDEDGNISLGSSSSLEASPRKGKMTARQAALKSVLESGHVSLDTSRPNPRKRVFKDTELALRKVESARKRRHFTERKLEDEKVETVSRLLKKNSTRRRKAEAAVEDKDNQDNDDNEDEDEEPPKIYRWLCTTQPREGEKKMQILFGVPFAALPPSSNLDSADTRAGDASPSNSHEHVIGGGAGMCAVTGCL